MTESLATAAWERVLDAVRSANETIAGPLGARTPRELAEGHRHVANLLSLGLETWVEHGDPLRPVFTRWMTPFRKVYGDNPWTIYDSAQIEGSSTYELRGDLRGPTYLGVCIYGRAENGDRRIIANVDDVELKADADGSTTITFVATGAEAPAGAKNIVRLEADADELMVRQYFVARTAQRDASYRLRRTPAAPPPPPLDDATIAERLERVAEYVSGSAVLELTLSALMASGTPDSLRHGGSYDGGGEAGLDDHIDPMVITKLTPSPAIQYTGSWMEGLAEDEMVVITGAVPTCRFWSIQLMNRFMESPDFLHHDVYLTGEDVSVDADGRFRIVIAHRDTGDDHVLETTGLSSVHVALRAIRAHDPWEVEFSREPWRRAR